MSQLVESGTVAEILGVSRRTVTRLLDAGDMPCEWQSKGHRHVRMSDVLLYKERSEAQEELLDSMRHHIHHGGLEDLDKIDAYLSQFDGEAQA